MKSIREWNMWESDVFYQVYHDPEHRKMMRFAYTMASSMMSLISLTGVAALTTGWLFLLIIPIVLFAVFVFPEMGRIHRLYHIINDGSTQEGHRVYTSKLHRRALDYLAMTDEEKKEYPRDILKVLADPDLTAKQKAELDTRMVDIRSAILERRQAKALLAKRNVDISHVLQYMDETHEGIKVQAKTYREYTDKS